MVNDRRPFEIESPAITRREDLSAGVSKATNNTIGISGKNGYTTKFLDKDDTEKREEEEAGRKSLSHFW
eukprot:CAMPEP_0202466106 /NCGR_PEP_ID=MMETSP1360-20130828/67628_1 /ASSEMBLY_ACC=CAM_ASM_000848 /TAXON_ID=515479 /ORGANISM="Licmophora paradoxa, Strain CCMP2313" /LENGTH=68 /DNA_ID=CAMNT_0049090119 /DNA_START=141 /DNA_END=344 /DNA_ORIENTATION=-